MVYKVVLQRSEEGFSVYCPGLPGCWAQGATESEALENIREAIQEYLATVDDLVEGEEVRQIAVHYDVPDFEEDLQTLRDLGRL